MKIRKKIIACVIAIAIAITSTGVSLYTYAFDKNVNINSALLDSILNDRYWIIETLVSGDISNNPYSNINPSSTNQTLMDEVLENYQNDKAFKALVDAMDVYSNPDQYFSGFADDILSTFEGWFGSADSADKIVASTAELKYESILNEIIKTDYTSSWGDTLFEENMDMEELKQQSKILKKIKSYQTVLKDEIGLNRSESSSIIVYDPYNTKTETFEIDIEDYAGHFLDAYEQDLGEYLNNIVEIPAIEGNEALKKKILATGALGMVTAYERTVIPKTNFDLDDIYYDGMYEDTMKIMKGAGKLLKITDKTMDCAILLEALQSQKNTTVQTMNRISSTTTDKDLAKVLDNYADLVNSAGDEKTLAYEAITNYLRNEQTVTNIITKKIKEQAPKLIKKAANKYAGAKTVVLSNAIAKAIAIVELSVWVADQTIGIEDTAKKIFVCKYLNKILNEAENVCLDDILAYKNDKTDENAEKVLSDLQFLKELRLYGEKSAYGSMCAQMESWIGIMLGGGDTKEYLDRRYQASIDTYLGCTFTPITQNEISLSQGDILTLTSDDVNNKSYSEAILKKADGSTVYFAEADYRLMGGIDLNGATVNILTAPNGFYLPLIENDTSGSVINIYCDNVAFGTISNTSDLTIEIKKSDKTFEITDSIDNTGTLNITNSLSSSKVSVYDINNSENINVTNCVLQCKGTTTNNGTITGMVDICGDGTQIYSNGYYKYGTQTMLGSGNYSTLMFNNYTKNGVYISGTQTITSSLSNRRTRIKNGKNLIATGNCSINNGFYGAVTLKDYTSPAYTKFKGDVFISGTVTFPYSAIFNEDLCLTSSCTSLTLPSDVTVNGDLSVNGGKISGNGIFNIKGDLNVTTSNFTASNLNFSGFTPQSAKSSSAITVGTLNNSNTSLTGVTFESAIYITDVLNTSNVSKYNNSEQMILTDDAIVIGKTLNVPIKASNWTCIQNTTIDSNLTTSGSVIISDGVSLNVENYHQSSGTFTNGVGSQINCSNNFYEYGTIVNNGIINVFNDFLSESTVTNNDKIIVGADLRTKATFTGGVITVGGDLISSNSFSVRILTFDSKMPQQFSNSSTTKVEKLVIKNTSKSGFTVNNVINVLTEFINKSTKINNLYNIVLAPTATNNFDSFDIDGNYNLTGTLIVPKDIIMNVSGNLILSSDSVLILEDNAILNVAGNLNASSNTITLNENSSIIVDDYLNASSSTFNIDGNLTIVGDAKLTLSTIGGNGTINFMGDVNSSSCTWNKPNVSFCGKTPQTVSGSAISVNNLTISNTSKSGITFSTTVNYYGEYIEDNSVINGSNYIVSKV